MSRHYLPLEQAVAQIHDGLIGDVLTCWAYRMHGPVGYRRRDETSTELLHQIKNYSNFTWLNGSFILDWLIHNLDVCCWVKDAWPVSAQGMGGRQVRRVPDQLFDHFAVEYRFADGTRMMAQGRHQAGCWGFFGDQVFGTKGSAVLGEGIPKPKIFSSSEQASANNIWHFQGDAGNAYQREHQLLFEAIRNDRPYNEAERCAYAAMTGILGRMAAESGRMIRWEEALNSPRQLNPSVDSMTFETEPPVIPSEQGDYPIAIPGLTKVL